MTPETTRPRQSAPLIERSRRESRWIKFSHQQDQRPPQDEHTGSSRYASAKSEEESNDSFEIQRMSLGPKGANLLRKQFERNEVEGQAGKLSATQFMNMVESDQVNSCFRAAMKKYNPEQARMKAGRSANRHPEPEIYMLDLDMESGGSRLVDSMTSVVSIGSKEARKYRRWQRQERRRVVNSLTKEFECLSWPS